MAYLNKHVVRKMEEQHKKDVKQFFLRIQELNLQLHGLLKKLEPFIEKEKYESIIGHVEKYVVHTDIWQLRFNNNLQNLEVTVLQVILLEHIYEMEQNSIFLEDMKELAEFKEELLSINNHVPKLLEIHVAKIQNSN